MTTRITECTCGVPCSVCRGPAKHRRTRSSGWYARAIFLLVLAGLLFATFAAAVAWLVTR